MLRHYLKYQPLIVYNYIKTIGTTHGLFDKIPCFPLELK